MKIIKKIFLVILACIAYFVQSYAQISFSKEPYYYAFKTSSWKGNAAPELFEIRVDSNPIIQSNVFTDLNGIPLSGTFQIIMNRYEYVIAELSKGIINGSFTVYKRNQEISKYLMKQGLYDGEQKVYNGSQIYVYEKGHKVSFSNYHDNGQLKSKRVYKNDEIDGDFIEYNKDGEVVTRQFFRNGKLDGDSWKKVLTNYRGGYIQKTHYLNGQFDGEYSETYFDGTMKIKGLYSNGKKEGEWSIHNTTDGKISQQENYSNDKLNGVRKVFANGELEKSENFKDNKKDGEALVYKENKGRMELVKRENYTNSKLDGICKYYYNGVLNHETLYKDDYMVTRKEFDRVSGELKQEELYNRNRLIGEKRYKKGKLQHLLLEDENGRLNIVREYSINGQSIKKNTTYKKGENLKLVEDEWGIIDI